MISILIKCQHGINDHALVSALANGLHIQRCVVKNNMLEMNSAEFLSFNEYPELREICINGAWDVIELAHLMVEHGECE